MEEGFLKAQSDNLPKINTMTMARFFGNNPDFVSAEIRGAKLERSGRDSYGDTAIGYVQVKREGSLCTVKGKITPEHNVRKSSYNVILNIDEQDEEIHFVRCEDCAASLGGCKHTVAFLTWLHRRSEEPAPTSVKCYWKKSILSGVGTSKKYIKGTELGGAKAPVLPPGDGSFLESIKNISTELGRTDSVLMKYFHEISDLKKLSLYYQINIFKTTMTNNVNPTDFIHFCEQFMPEDVCIQGSKMTCEQANNPLWHELRYGRVTASKIYSVAHCKTTDDTLVETILGAKIKDNAAMERGRRLEQLVLAVVEKQLKIKFDKCGIMLSSKCPVIGASPDAICKDYVVEVKCPFTAKSFKTYFKNDNEVAAKYNAQLQIQMHLHQKNKALFCVAHEDFEESQIVTKIFVNYDRQFTETIIEKSMEFWKLAVFPMLIS